jgi:hypothetical protein
MWTGPRAKKKKKKCIELREECVEQIPSLFAVACFLLGRVKGLSALPRTNLKSKMFWSRTSKSSR